MNKYRRKVEALERLAQDRKGKPEGDLALEKIKKIKANHPEAFAPSIGIYSDYQDPFQASTHQDFKDAFEMAVRYYRQGGNPAPDNLNWWAERITIFGYPVRRDTSKVTWTIRHEQQGEEDNA